MAYHAPGRKAESDAAFAELNTKYANKELFSIAALRAQRGDFEEAFEMLNKAARQHDLDLGAVAVYPPFVPMRADPRWLLPPRGRGLAPEQLAAIRFDVSVPKQ